MAVNPTEGTGSIANAAAQIEGLFGSDDMEGVNDLVEESAEAEEVEAEAEAVETEEPEAEAEETEAEADDAEPEEEEPEEPEATIESLSDVAEALEMSTEDVLATLTHTVKVDGETLEVSLDELARGYQKDASYRQRTEALKREQEQFEAENQQRLQALEDEHSQNAYVLNTIEQQIAGDFNSDELAQLRAQNPAEWTARRQELQDRLQGLQQLKQEAAQRLNQLKTQQAEEQNTQLAKTVEEESQKLREAIPDWGPDLQKQLNEHLLGEGYTPEQIGQVFDSRVVQMAYESMLYRQGKAQIAKTTKKVKAAPKLVKPTKPEGSSKIKRNEVQTLKRRLKKSGHVNDAAALIEKMI